jgi:hypothetical protein
MKQLSILLFVMILGLALAACSAVQLPDAAVASEPTSQPQAQQPGVAGTAQPLEQTGSQDMMRLDSQGAVTLEVTPTNLSDPGDELVFEISMNTHSVDLSMDLASLATLTADNGSIVQASLWDAPRGGHHVSGTLSFPASMDGKPVLDGATRLTLTINDVDAPERVFIWDLE